MGARILGEYLASRWLASIPPFSPSLVDTGKRYQGCPVFEAIYLPDCIRVHIYRYTPINSEHSFLAFVPENAVLNS